MEKIGYAVRPIYGGNHIDLLEVTVVGGPVKQDFYKNRWPVCKTSIIWSTRLDRELRKGEVFVHASWQEDVVFSLKEAKQKIIEALDESKKLLHKQQKHLADLDDILTNVDLDTVPKDEYISPFTGKKT